jgi:hypothetical protein
MTNTRTLAIVAWSALVLAAGAFVLSGAAAVVAKRHLPGASLKPRKFGILRLDRKRKFPASVLPRNVFDHCSPETVKIGTVCMMTNPYPLEKDDIGRNDFFFATQKCAQLGGYLPTRRRKRCNTSPSTTTPTTVASPAASRSASRRTSAAPSTSPRARRGSSNELEPVGFEQKTASTPLAVYMVFMGTQPCLFKKQ